MMGMLPALVLLLGCAEAAKTKSVLMFAVDDLRTQLSVCKPAPLPPAAGLPPLGTAMGSP